MVRFSIMCMCIAYYVQVSVSGAEHQNHAREIMRSFDVMTIHGIVISLGDGLLYEVSWEGGCAYSMPLVYRYMYMYVKVHVCILYHILQRMSPHLFSCRCGPA